MYATLGTDVVDEGLCSNGENRFGSGFAAGAAKADQAREDKDEFEDEDLELQEARQYVRALSGVLRLGRKGASTDHSSILLDVDIVNTSSQDASADASVSDDARKRCCSGVLGRGTTNRHWYALGLAAASNCPWLPPASCETHPDEPFPRVTGQSIPSINEAIDIVTRSEVE